MKRHISNAITVIAALGLASAAVGCRHADLNRELVEREMRLQEDEIYHLQDALTDSEKRLESLRVENAALQRQLDQTRGGVPLAPEPVAPVPPTRGGDATPRSSQPDIGPPTQVMPPQIQVPGLEGPPPTSPVDPRSSWRSKRGVRPANYQEDARESDSLDSSAEARPSNPDQIAKIVLSRQLTGGYDADRQLGDEGIRLVIEPRSEDDQLVRQAGDVAVVIVDPALTGEESRVARWDFDRDEITKHFEKTVLAEGIHLELPWPAAPPQHERLMVFVRLTTPDGATFEASQPILVDLALNGEAEAE
jgi:hypothetical protein